MTIRDLLEKLIDQIELNREEACWMMEQFMEGKATDSQMAAILTALRIKGESIDEISACAEVMRHKATRIPVKSDIIIDTCGTGGDNSGSFNISTTVALLLAGGGYKVAKHGNRSMTSKCGSADLLEALGVNLHLKPDQVAYCVEEVGIGFLFAPALHSSMKAVMPVRKELAVRTIFNMLGPLTNPAGANIQTIGVFSTDLVYKFAAVLKALGSRSAFTFSGVSGVDEVCIAGNTSVARLTSKGKIEEFNFCPQDYGYHLASLSEIRGGGPDENAEITRSILSGEIKGAKREVVVLNAGFAIAAAEETSLEEGFKKAEKYIDSGTGLAVIDKLAGLSQNLAGK